MNHRHELKTLFPFFNATWNGHKRFELRKNDRDFRHGDVLNLREWSLENGYTGRVICGEVRYMLRWFDGLEPGFVVMSLGLVQRSDDNGETWELLR